MFKLRLWPSRKLDQILDAIETLSKQMGAKLMAVSAQIAEFSRRVDAATNEIAKDLQDLRDKIAAGTPLTQEDADELNRLATRLEEMGKDPENPVP